MKIASCCMLGALALALLAGAVHASDYYVDAAGGSDLTGTGSKAQPWASITHALSQMPVAGPTEVHSLHLNPGVYDTLNGELFPLTVPVGVRLMGLSPSYSVIYGPGKAGVAVLRFAAGSDARTEITQLGIHAGDPGILVDAGAGAGSGPFVRLCRLSYNAVGMRLVAPSTGTREPVVEDCHLSTNTGAGIELTGGGELGGRIQDCWIDGNGGVGLDINAPGGDISTAVLGCVLLGNTGDGVHFRGNAGSGVTLSHLTVHANGNAGLAFTAASPSGLKVRNSIFHGNKTDLVGVPAALVTGTCFETVSGSGSPRHNLNGCLQTDPVFAQLGNPSLSPFSPVIDTVQHLPAVDPPNDIQGCPRTADGNGDAMHAPDMGAVEYLPLRDSGVTAVPGGVTLLSLDLPSNVSLFYMLGMAFSDTGIAIAGGRRLALWPDPLFALVVNGQIPFLHDFAGVTNSSGYARARIHWPNAAILRGITFHCAGVTVQNGFPGGIRCVTNGLAITLQ